MLFFRLTYQVRVFDVVQNGNIVELDVQVLVHTFQGSSDGDIILELHGHLCESSISVFGSLDCHIV